MRAVRFGRLSLPGGVPALLRAHFARRGQPQGCLAQDAAEVTDDSTKGTALERILSRWRAHEEITRTYRRYGLHGTSGLPIIHWAEWPLLFDDAADLFWRARQSALPWSERLSALGTLLLGGLFAIVFTVVPVALAVALVATVVRWAYR